MSIIKEFLGIGGYTREPEGYMSWQHLLFVSSLMVIMILGAAIIGQNLKNKDEKKKNRVLITSAVLIDSLELFKIIVVCIKAKSAMEWVYVLPLFLCSIQLIAIPMAAFCRGRLKEASLDFVMIFGILGAVFGTYFAGQNYGCYPVISIDNVMSGLTHCIAGFTSLYIIITGMVSIKKRNIVITMGILSGFCVAAYIANIFTNSNYMFLLRGDGTPYDILYNLVNGNSVLYPLLVVGLFVIYITAYYYVYYAIAKKLGKKNSAASEAKISEEEKTEVTV